LKQERKIRFFQKDAYFSMDFVAKQVNIVRKSANILALLPRIMAGDPSLKAEELVDSQLISITDSPKDALQMELESFVDSILQDKKPVVDGEAGTRALSVALEIIEIINSQLKKKL
ncbi:MAG TPA: gfo/Idh/MocA family oxidoreductase, partial [Candidatus Cloacimonadota bacterium]|nr:gfo/Idh/MocA family oxidoreductase [Candidatus Cloacimonadota bacterium]